MWKLKTLAVATTAFSISLAATAWYAHNKGKLSGMALVQQKWDSEKATVAMLHATQIAEINQKLQEAQNEVRQREIIVRRDVAASRAVVDGLRQQLQEANRIIATASAEAVAEYASAVSDVFSDCARAYQEMAEQADGHANDALLLYKGWPGRSQE